MQRLSNLLIATQKASSKTNERSHDLLLRGGFIRQSSAGIYSFLPFGLRVIQKLEALIDASMQAINGQKVYFQIDKLDFNAMSLKFDPLEDDW